MSDNITLPRATVQQALEVLERAGEELRWQAIGQVQRDLRTALEQQAEPVAWIAKVELSVFARTPKEKTTVEIWKKPVFDSDVAIYTTPPQRQWVGLTDEEIKSTWSQLWCDINKMKLAADDRPQKETVGFIFAKAVEAKLKEKNT